MFSGPDDDVSQSTMAAPSSKHWDANTMNSTAKGAPSEGMNATMTTIDAGEKLFLKPSMTPEEKKENDKLVKQYQTWKNLRYHFLEPEPFQNESLTSDFSRHRI